MKPIAAIVQRPGPDLKALSGITHQTLGKSLLAELDGSPIKRTDAGKWLYCTTNEHLSYSVLVTASDRDMVDILAICGMPAMVHETQARGIVQCIITGTLEQWKTAIQYGKTNIDLIASLFSSIQDLLSAEGVWQANAPRLLEYK